MQDVQYFSKIQYLLKATETLRPEGEGASPMGMLCWMGGGGGGGDNSENMLLATCRVFGK